MLGKYVLETDEGMSDTNCVEVMFGVDSRLRQKDCSQQNSSLPVQASSKPVARKSFHRVCCGNTFPVQVSQFRYNPAYLTGQKSIFRNRGKAIS